jgi:tRNA-specific 2-thiouridylase
MGFPLTVHEQLAAAAGPGTDVLLGVSGGVDSSVALALLQHLGCNVHCITIKNFCTAQGRFGGDANRSCCSFEAIDGARRLAARFDAKHWVSNAEDVFAERVIEPFVGEYLDGRTPNPCVLCNQSVRFPLLLHLADQLGCTSVATGHYARVEQGADGPRLLRGVDRAKDQSYFLHGLDPASLGRCLFPLGWSTKPEVRAAAAALGLESAGRPDSQEICFVPDDDRGFLFADRAVRGPGDIVDAAGRVLGRHEGLEKYTVGQRRGLGVAAPAPLYVLRLDAAANRLVVGAAADLAVDRIRCDGWRGLAPLPADGPDDGIVWTAQLRHRHEGVPVAGWRRDGNAMSVELAVSAAAAAPGQFLVLYADERVMGGGRIIATGGEPTEGPTCASC